MPVAQVEVVQRADAGAETEVGRLPLLHPGLALVQGRGGGGWEWWSLSGRGHMGAVLSLLHPWLMQAR
jgi:hypothetical protein